MNARKTAVNQIADKSELSAPLVDIEPVMDIFGKHVFSHKVMRERLPAATYNRLSKTIQDGERLDPSMADIVANAMKEWALEQGASHYTHWFQPMTNLTAEKHDAFLTPTHEGQAISEFSGKMLIKGEPDASSFPSGGIRSTFEARGYTAWDPTSPAFIMEHINGKTLYIPTAFYSYTGEALDQKTPLLRSLAAVSQQALRILRLFGDQTSTHVDTTLGVEQEYFLMDRKLYFLRPDLISAGRTLFSARPPKGQDLEDHYFGAIRPRVLAFMMDAEQRLYKLGIPVKTRHNEVAPGQFEIAPTFELANVATDHNMLLMETLRTTAEEHGLTCLLHEKPFAGLNGSGKHNNWSLSDAQGNNLLEPGNTPAQNAQFLIFLAAVLRAVHKYPLLIRLGTVGASNDHRLGANEAPPAIMSVFLGDQLTNIMESIIAGADSQISPGEYMEVGVMTLPPLPKDATDRNRTSPFAFTGNKFEFRAVGSSQSSAQAVIVINAAVSTALADVADMLETEVGKGLSLNQATQNVLAGLFKEHMPIVFNGDNYSLAWTQDAKQRNLPNLRNSVDALALMTTTEVVYPLTRFGILSEREIYSRQEIWLENYCRSIAIEAHLTSSLGRTIILPAAMKYQRELAENIISVSQALPEREDLLSEQRIFLEKISRKINLLSARVEELRQARAKVGASSLDNLTRAIQYRDVILPLMDACRRHADRLERLVDDDLWPLPKYREMLWLY